MPTNTIYRNDRHVTTITCLLMSGCPTTVLCRVVAVVVDPVDAVFVGWWFAHVVQEVWKAVRILPSFAYGNAATAVILVRSVIFVPAPIKHPLPDPVDFRCGVAMDRFVISRHASTTGNKSSPKIRSSDDLSIAANALTKPMRALFRDQDPFDYSQLTD